MENNDLGSRLYLDKKVEEFAAEGNCGGLSTESCRAKYAEKVFVDGGGAEGVLLSALLGVGAPVAVALGPELLMACMANPAACTEAGLAGAEAPFGAATAGGTALGMGGFGGLIGKEVAAGSDAAQGTGQVLREVEVSSGSKGAWTKELNKPEPNTIYTVDCNKTYQTDSLGRVERVESNLTLTKNDRNTYQQCVAGKCGIDGDEGGHLIASVFNGPGERLNLLPMNGNLNKGAWKAMENTWASALKQGQTVGVKIEPVYSGSSVRPDRFTVRYSIDGGRPVIVDFKNSPGGT